MKNLKESTIILFNWKKNPSSVFYFAIPLFAIAMSFMVALAYLQYKINADIWYAVIVAIAIISLPILLYPSYKNYKNIQKFNEKYNKKL